MKKGFTLVEMAIAVIVIGLLLTFAVKGKGIVETARIKKDINKVLKIKTAVASYYSKYHVVPGTRSGSDMVQNNNMYSDLIKEGLVKSEDFKRSMSNTYYHFVGCAHLPSGWAYSETGTTYNAMPYICLVESPTLPQNNDSSDLRSLDIKVLLRDICYYETLLDDKDVLTGEGRMTRGDTANLGKFDCKKQPNTFARYSFRVY